MHTPGLPAIPAVAVGHEGRGLLVAGGEKLDVVAAVHAVENLKHARSDDADHLADAKLRQDLGDGMSGGHLHDVLPPGCCEREAVRTMLFRNRKGGGQATQAKSCTPDPAPPGFPLSRLCQNCPLSLWRRVGVRATPTAQAAIDPSPSGRGLG